tara:strand:+ start:16356 stop:17300 length:945 start_codon:yes stop_codon:yes gene_type:complete
MQLILIIIIFFLIGFFSLKILIPALKIYLPDIPNNRSSHMKIKPRGGGLVFVILSLLSTIFHGNFSYLFSLPLSLISFIDDKYNISAKIRYLVQFSSAYIIIIYSPFERLSINLFKNKLDNLIVILMIVFGTSIVNFSNFMDGIDGLLAGCYSVVFFTIILKFKVIWLAPLLGGLLAFLKLNWEPSKIFMGDIGSTFLGLIYFSAILHINNLEDQLCILFIMGPIFIDALFTLIRRAYNMEDIFRPHKLHLYQRLIANGWSHKGVSIIYILNSILISLSFIFGGFYLCFISFLIACAIMYLLELKFSKPYKNNF